MGHRQLALIFAVGTAIVALLIAALRMMLGLGQPVEIAATLVVYAASSLILVFIAKKKWELDYKNAFIMLLSASVLTALIYAFGYGYVRDAFPEMKEANYNYAFASLFMVNVAPRLFTDAIAAIFYKR